MMELFDYDWQKVNFCLDGTNCPSNYDSYRISNNDYLIQIYPQKIDDKTFYNLQILSKKEFRILNVAEYSGLWKFLEKYGYKSNYLYKVEVTHIVSLLKELGIDIKKQIKKSSCTECNDTRIIDFGFYSRQCMRCAK